MAFIIIFLVSILVVLLVFSAIFFYLWARERDKNKNYKDVVRKNKEEYFVGRIGEELEGEVVESREEVEAMKKSIEKMQKSIEEIMKENTSLFEEFKKYQVAASNAAKNFVMTLAIRKVRKFNILKTLANFAVGDFSYEEHKLKTLSKAGRKEVENLLKKFISDLYDIPEVKEQNDSLKKDSQAPATEEKTGEPKDNSPVVPPSLSLVKTEASGG